MNDSYKGADRRGYDRDDLAQVARQAAEATAREVVPKVMAETFQNFGLDTSDKISMQEQMAYLRESAERSRDPDIVKDRAWIRANRERCERFYSTVLSEIGKAVAKWILIIIGLGFVAWLLGFSPIKGVRAGETGDWYKSLKVPGTGVSCCDISDCRGLDSDELRVNEGRYEILFRGEWRPVDENRVLSRPDNPTGGAVACISPGGFAYCLVPGELS